jgi:membrane-associated phospholipid phosphatase
MQHFLMDVWAGALLGIFSSLISYFIVLNVFSKKEHQTSFFKKLKGKPSI